ncbi:MAG: hypothetical protein C4519_12625 [Desulfobacteraceae bacterium]|nr:MAG: hypothetical protein C4519_12625 [Desulfobacteraceae bacterium]
MKLLPSAGIVMLMALATATAAGCYRSPDTTWYTPHVYKGSEDPLLGKLQERGLQQQLEERFRAVQTDR